jgi:hypothetical protein
MVCYKSNAEVCQTGWCWYDHFSYLCPCWSQQNTTMLVSCSNKYALTMNYWHWHWSIDLSLIISVVGARRLARVNHKTIVRHCWPTRTQDTSSGDFSWCRVRLYCIKSRRVRPAFRQLEECIIKTILSSSGKTPLCQGWFRSSWGATRCSQWPGNSRFHRLPGHML